MVDPQRMSSAYRFVLFDWGNTLMRDDPAYTTPMCDWPSVKVVDGADEVLNQLHAHATIALATSAAISDEAQIRRALARGHLADYVHKIYCFRNTGLQKPTPEYYHHILRDLGAAPAQALMVGDSFANDVLGANRVGVRAAWLNSATDEVRNGEMFWTIHSLRELLTSPV